MRRWLAVLMTLLSLALCACGTQKTDTQTLLDFRTALLSAGGCGFDADVFLEYEDEQAQFSLHTDASLSGGTILTLTAPETLRGLCAQVSPDGTHLSYDGAELGYAAPRDTLAPLCAPQLLISALSEGYLAWSGTEGQTLRATYQTGSGEQTIQIDVWFTDGTPCRAEFSKDGVLAISADIQNFSFNRG